MADTPLSSETAVTVAPRSRAPGWRRWREVVKAANRSPKPGTETDIHVVVDDAREWLPEVLNRLENQRPRIAVASAAPVEVSYDEVFIKIMQQDEQRQEAARG